MKKSLLSIYTILVLVLTACTTNPKLGQDVTESPGKIATAAETSTVTLPPEPTFTASPTVIPSPTPVPVISELGGLDIPQPSYADMLTELEPGVFEVTLDDIWQNMPAMPAFVWGNLQPDIPGLYEIVVEFDLIGTTPKWDDGWFGYERGFMLTLDNYYNEGVESDWNNFSFDYHLLAINLDRYIEREGNHITARIPVSQFTGGARDLVLRFFPGATFGNIRAYVTHDGRGTSESLELFQSTYENPKTSLHEIYPNWWDGFGGCDDPGDMYGCIRQVIYVSEHWGNEWDERLAAPRETGTMHDIVNSYWWMQHSIGSYMVNSDGSVNIPVSEYELGNYADEISGDFAVIPDGLLFPLIRHQFDILGEDFQKLNKARHALVNFMLTEMMNPDTGLIQGIWDIQNNHLVAPDRKAANLPLWAGVTNLQNNGVEIDQTTMNAWLMNIIEHEFELVGEKVYYTPRGIEDGTMELRLEDFAFIDTLFSSLYRVAMADPDTEFSLPDSEAVVTIMEGTHNSLALIVEQQELNPTHLPSETLLVHFDQNGDYRLEPVGHFSMDNPFFATMPLYLSQNLLQFDQIGKKMSNNDYHDSMNIDISDHFPAQKEILRKSNVYSPNAWYAALRQARAVAGEFYFSHHLLGNMWKVLFHVYNFSEQQQPEHIFSEKYDIVTGEPAGLAIEQENNNSLSQFQDRFGSLSSITNWFQLMTFFYNQEMVEIALSINEIGMKSFDNNLFSVCDGNLDWGDPDNLKCFIETGFNPISFDTGYLLTFQGSAPDPYDQSGYGKGIHFPLRYAETFSMREDVESWEELLRLMDESDGFMGRKLRELFRDVPGFVIPTYPAE